MFCDASGWRPFVNVDGVIDIAPCFRNVIITAVPLALLAGSALGSLLFSSRRKTGGSMPAVVYQSSRALGLKMSAAFLAIIFTTLARFTAGGQSSVKVMTIVSLIAEVGIVITHIADYCRRIRINWAVTAFWMWSILTAIISLRSWSLEQNPRDSLAMWSSVGVMVGAALVLAFDELMPVHSESPSATPRDKAGALSMLTWAYIWPVLRQGMSRDLTFDRDVWPIPHANSNDHNTRLLEMEMGHPRFPSTLTSWALFCVLIRTQTAPFVSAVMLKTVGSLIILVQPVLLDLLIDLVSSEEDSLRYNNGMAIVAGIFATGVASALLVTWGTDIQWNLNYRWRTGMVGVIYRKSLRLCPDARVKFDIGAVTNLVDNDAIMVGLIARSLPNAISVVVQLAVATVVLWRQLSYATILVILGFGILGPMQEATGKLISTALDSRYETLDKRVSVTGEILRAMKLVKFYAWESFFIKKIRSVRNTELKYLAEMRLGEVLIWLEATLFPLLIFAAALAFYIKVAPSDEPLDANRIFVSLALLNLLRAPLTSLSMDIPELYSNSSSFKRCVEFLNSDDATDYVIKTDMPSSVAVEITNGNFAWSCNSKASLVLRDLNLAIARKSLTAIVGKVGAGKSSILAAIRGDMAKISGSVTVTGKVLYVSQKPWLLAGTIKENILLGGAIDEAWYQKVVAACALTADLDALPAGDRTEIGGHGVTLSGGQRQRISLARAVYGRADTILVDDTLSACDAHVGRHIFEQVLGPNGLLKDVTRIVVTHAVQYLESMDRILIVDDGCVVEQGSFDELCAQNGKLTSVMAAHGAHHDGMSAAPQNVVKSTSSADVLAEKVDDKVADAATECSGALIEDEEQVSGRVGNHHFLFYIKACTWPLFLTFLISVGIAEGLNLGSRYWLLHWSDTGDSSHAWYYFGVYSAIILAYTVLYTAAAVFFLYYVGPKASAAIHDSLLLRVMRYPMSFFDTTPIGRILTRFQSNVGKVDVGLPDQLFDATFAVATIIANLLPTVINSPLFIVFAAFCVLLFGLQVHVYLGAALSYMRMKMSTEADHLTQIDESLAGISTIKAFSRQRHEAGRNATLYDRLQATQICYYYTNRWLDLSVQILSAAVTAGAAVFAISASRTISPAQVGLIVSATLSLSAEVSIIMQRFGQFQNDLVSLERINGYTQLPVEEPDSSYAAAQLEEWPVKGDISYQNVSLRYREGLPLVLRGVSFDIKSGERVGVVGRTGAGKSSLILSLLRLVDPTGPDFEDVGQSGRILIDGVDISTVSLTQLRSSIAMIPQESFMFQGTLRENLDPFGHASDEQLWTALDKVSLKPYVSELPEKLDAQVQIGGENFSMGQRQLLALARLLASKPARILVMDEASASVDIESDAVLQRVIRTEFAGRTIITIAHRIHTVLDSDKVIVLDSGEIAEMDNPRVLMAQQKSKLYQLVHGQGQE
ncbi:hypothetical protein HDU88_004917 [Geranomyces variabilis]|nr:hypothetical protein HDU88_004917 [Geranomyces variabilis]